MSKIKFGLSAFLVGCIALTSANASYYSKNDARNVKIDFQSSPEIDEARKNLGSLTIKSQEHAAFFEEINTIKLQDGIEYLGSKYDMETKTGTWYYFVDNNIDRSLSLKEKRKVINEGNLTRIKESRNQLCNNPDILNAYGKYKDFVVEFKYYDYKYDEISQSVKTNLSEDCIANPNVKK